MRHVRRLAALSLTLLVAACSSMDTSVAARRDAAAALECPEAGVEMDQVGEYRYTGRGCGREVVVVCTASALEPRCISAASLASAGGEASSEPEAEALAGGDAEASNELETLIRAGLENRRDDIRACTGRERVAVRAAYAPDGSVDLTLQGELSGTPEERCVQDALDGVRVAATGEAGVVVHLVRLR